MIDAPSNFEPLTLSNLRNLRGESMPLRVGIAGSGFVAKLRASLFHEDPRTVVTAIAGNITAASDIAAEFGAVALPHWSALVTQPDVDLVVVCNVNRDHALVAEQALRAGKHVIVEYPLAFDVATAQNLITLAQSKDLLLHVEHIELLGGVHRLVVEHLPHIGIPIYARYSTQGPQNPAPDKWTYQPELFGFPLIAAVSRLNRLIVLWGKVNQVSCQVRYIGANTNTVASEPEGNRYRACICNAQLQFANGVIADVSYSKGEYFWKPERIMEVQGSAGGLWFSGDKGTLRTQQGDLELDAGTTRGLFKKDTANVLGYLFGNESLYVKPEAILHSLQVAVAAAKSAQTNQVVILP
ncbi:MAG: Gfo/Idh/MocA family oxidoreductase [Pseudanabaena sp. ELA607]